MSGSRLLTGVVALTAHVKGGRLGLAVAFAAYAMANAGLILAERGQ